MRGAGELRHKLIIVGRDDDGGAEAVQLDEKPQQAARHLRVDVTGRLVGEQKLGLADHRAGDSGALLLSARQNHRIGVHPVAKAHPFQKLGDILRVIGLLPARDPQGKRHIFPGRQMIEQPEVLKNDADAAS